MTFSKRHGFRSKVDPVDRDVVPLFVRDGFVAMLRGLGVSYGQMRETFCQVLRKVPDPTNWSEVPNVRDEVVDLVRDCEWFRFYDLCEAAYGYFFNASSVIKYEDELNSLFEECGIAWKAENRQVVAKGSDEFEQAVENAVSQVQAAGLSTPESELSEARHDLSRRPEPDVTGSVQHCLAALECVARVITGDEKATLGDILKRYGSALDIPKPLDIAAEKLWGFASEVGRHLREGREPEPEEAELLLITCSGLITYLLKKHKSNA